MEETKHHRYVRIPIRINQIELSGDLYIPSGSDFLVILILGEKDDKFLERFLQLKRNLNDNQLATFFIRALLTEEEREISANRLDESLLADRLVAITKELKSNPETKKLKFAYIGLSSIAERLFRTISVLRDQIESLVLIGNGLPTLNLVFSEIPILNIIGELDFRGIEANKLNLSKIEAPVKKFHLIQSSPSHFEDQEKWFQVSQAVLRWFYFSKTRLSEFAE
ncbi:dienelactone hydrolase [Leptospira sp. 'Mane']|uniref:dienelactone hydrolase n=1 Tax=Leptospira sp. 'Mane' TaxID=3387407 RepID=UPI00398AFFAE